MTEQKRKYMAYIRSATWAQVKLDLYANRGKICEVCGSNRKVEVHHITYERLGNEEPSDLVVLCKKHHMAVHSEQIDRIKKAKNERSKRAAEKAKKKKDKIRIESAIAQEYARAKRKNNPNSWRNFQKFKKSLKPCKTVPRKTEKKAKT